MRRKNLFIICILSLFLIGAACFGAIRTMESKDNKLYIYQNSEPVKDIVKIDSTLNITAESQFYSLKGYNLQDSSDKIALTLSPDKTSIYYMAPLKSSIDVVKGPFSGNVSIIKHDISTDKDSTIALNVPFITIIKWDPSGKFAAFSGGGKLTIYDSTENKLIFTEELENENVNYFGWSPKGDKLYAERSNLPNSIILSFDTLKKSEPYEIKEETYYKYKINKDYYYGTKQKINSANVFTGSSSKIVILDRNGNLLKELSEGIFRDSYNNAILTSDKNDHLYYIKDINESSSSKLISSKKAYEVKFLSNRGFVFTTQSSNIENNSFELHICDSNGVETAIFEVPGCSFFLSTDGSTGYINAGEKNIKMDFISGTFDKSTSSPDKNEEIYRTLRGGFCVISDYLINGKKDQALASRYFDSSIVSNLQDILNNKSTWNGLNISYLSLLKQSDITMKLKMITPNVDNNVRMVDTKIDLSISALWAEDFSTTLNVRLVLQDSKWFIKSLGKITNN